MEMIAFEYLGSGLNALARAHQMSSMAGHLGAAMIAGYFVGEQRPGLEPEVYRGIEGDLNRVMRGDSVFGQKMSKNAKISDPELFAPFPHEKPSEGLIDDIAEALAKNVGQARQSGHNVIFASLAIRALKEHPELATPSVVDGIRKLIALFDEAHPGSGYYGKAKGRIRGNQITLPEDESATPYQNLTEMADVVLDEIIHQDPKFHRQGYGDLVHINNHAAAIVDLAAYGYTDLVPPALASHYQHLRLWRNLPNVADELGPLVLSRTSPHRPEYWTSDSVPYDRALLTHRVKTMYGFDELADVVESEEKRDQAYLQMRYWM